MTNNPINRTRVLFCDLLNLPRGKFVSTSYANGGKAGFARGVFGTTYDRDLISAPGADIYRGIPDMDLRFDDQRRVGWGFAGGYDIALGDLHVDDKPFETVRQRAIAASHRIRMAKPAWPDPDDWD